MMKKVATTPEPESVVQDQTPRVSYEEIVETIRQQYLSQQEERETRLRKKNQAFEELTSLGLSEESARLITGLTETV